MLGGSVGREGGCLAYTRGVRALDVPVGGI